MNHFYLEQSSKERIRQLRAEGLMSQAYHRSRPAGAGLLARLRRYVLGRLGAGAGKQKEVEITLQADPLLPHP